MWVPLVSSRRQAILVAGRRPAQYDTVTEKAVATYAGVAHYGVSPDSEDLSGYEQCIRFSRQQRDVHDGVDDALR